MQAFDDTKDTFPRILQTLADLMSQHTDDRSLGAKTLLQCDEELDTLRSVQNQLERRVALVCRRRNTFAPINALPPELVVHIFKIVINSEPFKVWSDLEALMMVCYHWNHLISNTPSVWTKIQKTAKTPNTIIIRALQMSKDSPFEIECDEASAWMAQEDQDAFLSVIFPHAHRWKKVSLWLGGELQGLEPITTLSAPLLESLSLHAPYNPGWTRDEPLDIFGGCPPETLQALSLCRIPVPWTPATLCNLKVLEITNIHSLGPSLDQLFAILSASPDLESLSMQDVTFPGGASTSLLDPIHMPTLGKLSVDGISLEMTNRILAAIRAPMCKSGSLAPNSHIDSVEAIFTPDISHFSDHIRSAAVASLFSCIARMVVITWFAPWRLRLLVEDIRIARRVLGWLSVSPKPNSSAVPLHLAISERDHLLVEDILAVMADTEAVHRITFHYDTPFAGALRMLATGGLADSGAREIFPALTEMSISQSLAKDEDE